MKKLIISLIFSLALLSCTKDDITPSTINAMQVEISATVNEPMAISRATSTNYTGQDLSLTINYGTSDRYTSQDIKWTYQENKWSNLSNQLWKNTSTSVSIYAYAPYQETVSDYTAIAFSAQTDQSQGTESSDLVGYTNSSYTPTDAKLILPFEHKMAQVIFNVSYSTLAYDDTDFASSSALVNAVRTISYDATTATATTNGNSESITPYSSSETSGTRTYSAIVAPQIIASGTRLLDLGYVAETKLLYLTKEDITLKSGYSYIFNLSIATDDKLELSDNIQVSEGWQTDNNMGSGSIAIDIKYNSDDNTYYIYTAKGLAAFRDLVNGAASNTTEASTLGFTNSSFTSDMQISLNGTLMNDINLADIYDSSTNWSPIGNLYGGGANHEYGGIFNGNCYTISGLNINTAFSKQGLFGYADQDAIICNLEVIGDIYCDNTSSATYETGGIVACNSGLVINCVNRVNVSGNANVGGIAGYNYGYVVNCANHGTITGLETAATNESECGKNIGGLVGQNGKVTVNDIETYGCVYSSYNTGTVTGKTRVGGIAGYLVSIYISGCYYLLSSADYAFGGSTSVTNSVNDMQNEFFLGYMNTERDKYQDVSSVVEPSVWVLDPDDGYPTPLNSND